MKKITKYLLVIGFIGASLFQTACSDEESKKKPVKNQKELIKKAYDKAQQGIKRAQKAQKNKANDKINRK